MPCSSFPKFLLLAAMGYGKDFALFAQVARGGLGDLVVVRIAPMLFLLTSSAMQMSMNGERTVKFFLPRCL